MVITGKTNHNTFLQEACQENRRVESQMTAFIKERYFWYLVVLAAFFSLFTYATNIIDLIGLAPRPDLEFDFYVALYRTVFIMSAAIAAWRFGLKGGLGACFALALIMFSPYVAGVREPNVWIDTGVIVLGILTSWMVGRQGKMQRLLREAAEELQWQTEKLSQEITERKQVEEKIKHAAEEWRTTFDSITDLVSINDSEQKILRVNTAFAKAFNMMPQDVIGKHCYEVVHGTQGPLPNCPHIQTMKSKKPAKGEFLLPDRETYLHISTSPMFNDNGEVVGSVHIARDITKRRQMEEQLIMTDRLASIGELVAGTAHELNNPLTTIIGFSQLLKEGNIPDEIKDDLDTICGEAERSAGIVKNLLSFARKHGPVKQVSRLTSIIEDVLKLRAYEQRVGNIKVVTQFAPDVPEIMVDYFQMQQVFFNIIINAENAMTKAHNGGTLTINTERINHFVKVSFIDDGPGITKENMGRIFNPFFTTKEVGKGTGLGLSICHGIVTEHEGRIYAKSNPGKGTTFIVELPVDGYIDRGTICPDAEW
jgi:PAS domain S-box-containing protein